MELRETVPDIEVVVAPTPELDRLIDLMVASMLEGGGTGPSYFENGRVTEDTLASLFQAADTLFQAAPWKLARDSQVMRLDFPALGVEGACVSVPPPASPRYPRTKPTPCSWSSSGSTTPIGPTNRFRPWTARLREPRSVRKLAGSRSIY